MNKDKHKKKLLKAFDSVFESMKKEVKGEGWRRWVKKGNNENFINEPARNIGV